MRYAQHLPTRNFDAAFLRLNPPNIEAAVFTKELQHRSIISYLVPRARVRELIPIEFDLAEMTMVSIESFLDRGRTSFEQTNYRFHVNLEGKACCWLLGTSLGSLLGIAARHLYPLPWHLSAMELRVAFDSSGEKYKQYHLNTQSQWANAKWEIVDTGVPLTVERKTEIIDYFVRRDGKLGSYQMRYKTGAATRGRLKAGHCDLLVSLGILSNEEMKHPVSATLQRSVSCEIKLAARPFSLQATA